MPARGLAARDAAFFSATVDALSMRNFGRAMRPPRGTTSSSAPSPFRQFAGTSPDAIAATLEQAARDRVSYVELIANPASRPSSASAPARWTGTPPTWTPAWRRCRPSCRPWSRRPRPITVALDARVPSCCAAARQTPASAAACASRYVPYALRTLPAPVVFGQMLMGYAVVQADPQRYAGVNIVAPEDNPVALRDYRLHMAMFKLLSARYPQVPLTLHRAN